MVQVDIGTQPDEPSRNSLAVGTLLFVLTALVSIAAGIGAGLLVSGLAALLVGAHALIRGRADWVRTVSRRTAMGLAVAGFAAVGVGSAVSPQTLNVAADAGASATEDATAVLPADPAPAAPPEPVLAMTCPVGGPVAAPRFGQQITATAPYRVTIDYGDGDTYTNDDQHLGAIFSHTYQAAGTYRVQAVLADATGRTVTASCTYLWAG